MTASGGAPDAGDGVGVLWAGAIGGALSGYQMDVAEHEKIPAKERLKVPAAKRFKKAQEGFKNGAIMGMLGGALASVWSGSSDQGVSSGSSASSQSPPPLQTPLQFPHKMV